MRFNEKYFQYLTLFEKDLNTFSGLSIEDKIQRLSQNPYTKGLYYHVTDPKNMENILRNGFTGEEMWFTKDRPHDEYTGGMLFEVNLSGYNLKPDPRWKDEHKVFISNKEIPPERITRIYKNIDKLDLREDELAVQMNGASEDQIRNILLKYNI